MSDWEVLKSNLEALKKKVAGGQDKPADSEKLEELKIKLKKLKDDSLKTPLESDILPVEDCQNLIEEIDKELKPNTPATRESK